MQSKDRKLAHVLQQLRQQVNLICGCHKQCYNMCCNQETEKDELVLVKDKKLARVQEQLRRLVSFNKQCCDVLCI